MDEQPASIHPSQEQSMNDYKPIRPLGKGHMGTVFLVVHRDSNQPLALKIMAKEVLLRRDSLQRAETEKEILSNLDHPFLPSLTSHFETDKHKVLVMDYCSGGDMNVLRHRQHGKKFSEAAVRFYGAEVVLALEHLHQIGIVYRDLKPENILVQSSGHIMLTDFDLSLKLLPKTPVYAAVKPGKTIANDVSSIFSCFNPGFGSPGCMAARPVRQQQMRKHRRPTTVRVTPLAVRSGNKASSTGKSLSFVGTDEYVAPEVLLETGHDFAVDWWTLGILLYELVHGKTPFKGANRKETYFNILSREPKFSGPWSPLQDLLRKLLAKEPGERLGYDGGAEEVKAHPFFQGVQWDVLQHVSRPPFVPAPVSEEDMEVWSKGGYLDMEEQLAKGEKGRGSGSREGRKEKEGGFSDEEGGSAEERRRRREMEKASRNKCCEEDDDTEAKRAFTVF